MDIVIHGSEREDLLLAISSLLIGEKDRIASLANLAALLWEYTPEINWLGFYLIKENELVLGPFQGKVACTRIQLQRGVCGQAVRERTALRVDDVLSFPGHIACDAASRSELVVPLILKDNVVGVLDIDSPIVARFTSEDEHFFATVVKELMVVWGTQTV